MKVIFIRHGMTLGNLKKRYVGTTDEELMESSIDNIRAKAYPEADVVYSSPMLRCKQTAAIIYKSFNPIHDFKEIDFGDFENLSYIELKENPDFQKWIESNGEMPFPNGESMKQFKKRCNTAFETVVKLHDDTIAFVVHGGTIMSILEKYSSNKSSFYDWQIDNGNGYTAEYVNGKLENIQKLW